MKNIYFKFKNTAILLLLLISSIGFGQVSQTFDNNGTYLVPAGITSITVQAWGAGGGGGGGSGNNSAGGGGGGAYAKYLITVTPGQNYIINVGKGGGSNTSGASSSVTLGADTLVQATGGGAGSFSGTQLGGVGGSANIGGVGLIVSYAGGDGGKGTGRGGAGNEKGGAGGGGSAGSGGIGGNGLVPVGRAGGAGGAGGLAVTGGDPGSAGGAGGTRYANAVEKGNIGFIPGSGGGGRSSSGTGISRTAVGGAGADGQVIITYNCPSDAGILSGTQNICTINGTTTFSATLAGGIWSSSSNAIATVSTSGLVTGKSFGTAVITYTIASPFCATRTITREVYIGNKPDIAAISTPATLCSGAPFNPAVLAVTANSSVVTSQGWQLETAVSSGVFAILTIPYTVNFVDNGKKIRYFATNSCGTTYSNQVNLTVTPLNTASIASSSPSLCYNTSLIPITHTTTGATGIGAPVNLPSGVTASWVANQITITGTPTVKGIFNYSIPLTGGCGNINATGTIEVNDGVITTFNGSWDNGIPDITKKAVLKSNYDTSVYGNITACNCEVNPLATLTIAADTNAVILNNIINNGNIVVESDGNLSQIQNSGSYSGTGNFTVNRIGNIKRLDYVYWSSPVTGQNLKAFSPGTVTSRFLTYNEADDYFYPVFPGANSATTDFTVTKGYAIRAKNTQSATPQDWLGVFKGIPNNGVKAFKLAYSYGEGVHENGGYNLVGNPYPSNITLEGANGLLDKNSSVIAPVAYFWNNVVPNVPAAGQNYGGDNYAIYNKAGGTPPGNSTIKPDGIVKVGQGFIVQALPTANNAELVFDNLNRDATTISSNFYDKKKKPKDRFWLQLTTQSQDFTTLLIAYVPNATNDFEADYDAALFSVSSDAIFSILEDQKLGIQARKYPLDVNDVVPLGTNHFTSGKHMISLQETEGVFANGQPIYLKDRETGIVTNLSKDNYHFKADQGLTENRFEILYKPQAVLGTDQVAKENVVVYRDGNNFVVKSPGKKIIAVELYDASGRLLVQVRGNNTKTLIPAENIGQGVYILKINQEGEITSRKVIK